MCGSSSDEQIRGIGKEPRRKAQEATEMFTTDSVKAEVTYRRERLSRDYGHGRTARRTGARRHLVHLFTKNV
jgi:hypothetical protein